MYKWVCLSFLPSNLVLIYHRYANANIGPSQVGTLLKCLPHHEYPLTRMWLREMNKYGSVHGGPHLISLKIFFYSLVYNILGTGAK